MVKIRMCRSGRKLQIEHVLAHAFINGKTYLTMREIARRVNLYPSNHLLSILYEMVNDGILSYCEYQHRPNIIGRMFCLKKHETKQGKLL